MTAKVTKKNKIEEIDESIIGDELTVKQEIFCRNYTQNYVFMGNATLSYAYSYGYPLDEAPRDDAEYLLKDGTVVLQNALDSMSKDKKDGMKLVKESTYSKLEHYCGMSGSRMMRNDRIQKRCIELSNEFLRDDVIDRRLKEIALRGEDKDSIQAIKEYNKLKQRITEKVDHTSKGEKIAGFNFVRADATETDDTNNADNSTD